MNDTETPKVYDAVVCVGPRHLQIAKIAIKSLSASARVRRVYVATNRRFFKDFQPLAENGLPVVLLDENTIIDGVSLATIEEYQKRRAGEAWGSGWYLQQFLKIGMCRQSGVGEYYLIWDADTIMLQPIDFFDSEGRVLVNPKEEYHEPYFELTRRLLGVDRCVPFSFISEHMMVNTVYMRRLLESIESRAPSERKWAFAILDNIELEHLKSSGFSEFETYGNFIHVHYPGSYRCRPLKTLRWASSRFGLHPNLFDLYQLLREGYYLASFEKWNRKEGWKTWPFKTASAAVFWWDTFFNVVGSRQHREQLNRIAIIRQ